MAKFRKKPVVIDAWNWNGDSKSLDGLDEAFGPEPRPIVRVGETLKIDTLEGQQLACSPGDWVIRGVKGEFCPCKPDIFAATYEAVGETPTAGQTFGWAIKQMQNGSRVQREGWNGKGMFIYLEDGLSYEIGAGAYAGTVRTYEPCIVMFTAQGKHQPGWLASQADMLAADWRVVNDDVPPRERLPPETSSPAAREEYPLGNDTPAKS